MTLKAVIEKTDFDALPAEVQEHYVAKGNQYTLDADGMVTTDNLTRSQEALRKEREDHKGLKTLWSPISSAIQALGKKPEEIIPLLDSLPELEAAAAAGNGADPKKIDALVETRIKSRLAPVERERDQYKTQVVELTGQVTAFQTQSKASTIEGAIRKAALAAKVVDADDVVVFAERLFELDDRGNVVTKDNVGVTPGLGAEAWLTDMTQKKPHWFGANIGGGANPSNVKNLGPNPFTFENWNMTEQGKLVRENPTKATQLAKAAGTTVGGPKPAAKK